MDTACIEWPGHKDRQGYGKRGGRLAHRLALERFLERPLVGMALHRCDNPSCVNPQHLYEGTHADNMRDLRERGGRKGIPSWYSFQTHCKRGHEFTAANTRVSRGARHCRACDVIRQRAYKARKQEVRP